MKPSYERTPRSMDEAVFLYNADPIEHYEKQPDLRGGDLVIVLVVVVVAFFIAISAF